MLSFLSPLFLAGAAAAAVPILLHLLKRQPEPKVKFGAVRFLKQAPVEVSHRRRLRELLLLALRVAALVLLAVAFARPFFASGAALGSAGATIVAIDTSYSMSAPGQMARARQLAAQAVGRAPSGDLVGVLTFDTAATVVAAPSADRGLARSAIARVAAGTGATRYRAAIAAAVEALGGRRGTIVVVTDLQEIGWDAGDRAPVPDSAHVEVADVGAPPPDLAVTSVRTLGDRILATVRNIGPQPRDAAVRLVVDGRPAGSLDVAIGANASGEAAFPVPAGATAAQVSVDDPGGASADNVRYAVLDRAGRVPLLVVTSSGNLGRDAFYVQQALEAGAGGREGYQVTGTGAAGLASFDASRLGREAAVLLLSTRGLERRGREALAAYVQHGGGLLIAAGPDIDGAVAGDVLGDGAPLRIARDDARPQERALAPADVRHPIFRSFGAGGATLGLVKFQTIARISGAGCQTLARFTTGEPALLDCAAGDGRGLAFASDLNHQWNDFPLRATFVPFLQEAVRYLSSGRDRPTEYVVHGVPAGVPDAPGVITLPGKGPGEAAHPVAVNVDPRETDTARLTTDEFGAAVMRLQDVGASEARVERREQEDRQHIWRYLLLLMLATLAVEGLQAGRTA